MNKKYLLPSITALSVFVACLGFIFIAEYKIMDQVIFLVCLLYGLVCLLFLLFQLYAFYKAHTEYNEEIENAKYLVFEAEGISVDKLKHENL
jgi:hypothetical protein